LEYAGFAMAAALVGSAVWGVTEDEIPRIGVLTAAFFVASQVHLPLGGMSVHLLLNGLLGVVLGRRAPLAIAVGLFLQAFLFGHGGLTTLGVNVAVYAVPALVAGVLFRPARRTKLLPDFALGVVFGGATGLATVGLNFAVLTLGPAGELGRFPFVALAANLPVVVVEAVGVGVVVRYLGRAKPEWLT
ncbi:MAG: energy-coupling factor ABC transporter permease, partial [Fimbriiglobus sp.]